MSMCLGLSFKLQVENLGSGQNNLRRGAELRTDQMSVII
jgi:hypothetical protein